MTNTTSRAEGAKIDLAYSVRDALELYAESCDIMARMKSGNTVACSSVAYDIRKNMVDSVLGALARATQHASAAPTNSLKKFDMTNYAAPVVYANSSSAAPQAPAAEVKPWQERLGAPYKGKHINDIPYTAQVHHMEAEIADLRGKLASAQKDAERYQYLKATTTAIRDPETGEREECTPDQFEQAIDAELAARAQITNTTGPRCMGMDCVCNGDCPDLKRN